VEFGFCVEHEQFDPTTLLKNAIVIEEAGFDRVLSSDHFHPWAHTNASGGFAWTWLASTAQATYHIKVGTEVTAPLLRYHPGLVAQAFATLDYMYPGRIFLGVGLGEAMNEVPLGYPWPPLRERIERLEEALIVIKRLWTEDFVTYRGRYYRLQKANLYTKPKTPIPIHVATTGPKVAELAGRLADGLHTVPLAEGTEQHLRRVLFPAFERGARKAGRDPSRLFRSIQIPVSYHEDYDQAVEECRFWAATVLPAMLRYNIYDPREIEEHGQLVDLKKVARIWVVSDDLDEHIRRLEPYLKLGFDVIYFQSVNWDQEKVIRAYGERVLPYLKELAAD
jgi:coenzyme F420-dependent glucose-6-phosphate dehydrogenase